MRGQGDAILAEYGKGLRRFVCREASALGDSPAVGIIAGWPRVGREGIVLNPFAENASAC